MLRKIIDFYVNGFKSMTYGKSLWLIIGIKLFIMFAIFRVFFFQNDLNTRAESEQEKANYVIEQLTKK